MEPENGFIQEFKVKGGDFSKAGSISTEIKEILQEVGIDSSIIRRVAIASYEAEMNMVMYSRKGEVSFILDSVKILIKTSDEGPGIEDIDKAMQEGFSTATDEMREMGFGAGMGLPNIKKHSDEFKITSEIGKGTNLSITFYLEQQNKQ
ncbi:MAG: anti-sigma regulatory factor [Candidatus Aminicenantes bacterium]|nr:anti-sigma regulatory factor [Candidatus Aminicenantes bacterium]